MVRPTKTGLDYFPFDIDFFDDEKIIAIAGEFGIKGEITAVKLLCAIYRNGYFILWNDLLKYKLLKNLPSVTLDLLENIVYRLVLWGFFDKSLFDSARVLTSKGIQRRYFEAVKRRKTGEELPHLLVYDDNKPVNVNINHPRKELMSTLIPQRKEKKSKVNKPPLPPTGGEGEICFSDGDALEETPEPRPQPVVGSASEFGQFLAEWNAQGSEVVHVRKPTDSQRKRFKELRKTYTLEEILEAVRKIKTIPFHVNDWAARAEWFLRLDKFPGIFDYKPRGSPAAAKAPSWARGQFDESKYEKPYQPPDPSIYE